MSRWYYRSRGKTKGPALTKDVILEIRLRRVSPYDLVFQEGDVKWRPVASVEKFREVIKSLDKPSVIDHWVLLRQDSQNKKKYLQEGPFSTSDIRNLVQVGSIQYSDFVWKPGMSAWEVISSLEVFNPDVLLNKMKDSLDLPTYPEEIDPQNILDQIVLEGTPEKPEPPKPTEAEGPDLVSPEFQNEYHYEEDLASPGSQTERRPKYKELKQTGKREAFDMKRFFRGIVESKNVFIGASIAMAIVGLVLIFAAYKSFKDIQQSKEVVVAKPRVKPVVKASPPKVVVAKVLKKQPIIREERRAPKKLTLKLKSGSMVEFGSDGTQQYVVNLTVLGRVGSLANQDSYYFSKEYAGGKINELDLSKTKINNGSYEIKLTSHGLNKIINYTHPPGGVSKSRLDQRKKSMVYRFELERRLLIQAVDQLKKQGQGLVSSVQQKMAGKAYKGLKARIASVSIGGLGSNYKPELYLFPEVWNSLRQLKHQMESLALHFSTLDDSASKASSQQSIYMINLKLEKFGQQTSRLNLF